MNFHDALFPNVTMTAHYLYHCLSGFFMLVGVFFCSSMLYAVPCSRASRQFL